VEKQGRKGMGISFECPTGSLLLGEVMRIAVWFKNPIDGGEPIADRTVWDRTGDTFENLTLSPSIDCSPDWHGCIQNGEIT